MTTKAETGGNPWRVVFIVVQIVLVVSGVLFALIRAAANSGMHIHRMAEDIVGIVFLVSTLALLFGSPWFIRSDHFAGSP